MEGMSSTHQGHYGHSPVTNLRIHVLTRLVLAQSPFSLCALTDGHFIAKAFLFENEAGESARHSGSDKFQGRNREEIIRTYFDKVRVHAIRSANGDDGEGSITYRYGTVELHTEDFLGVPHTLKLQSNLWWRQKILYQSAI
ncbi:hypothetical protein A0H81_02741 [Grifola frondosa]|uniref:Uncharacterized protein n=1 Tax=Grifola frondosa TaxID=5627 RepID=A0A1C7MKI9_GRIFR|nr:hypothetical protein A0H81_02741 [Grifola frondosa]